MAQRRLTSEDLKVSVLLGLGSGCLQCNLCLHTLVGSFRENKTTSIANQRSPAQRSHSTAKK